MSFPEQFGRYQVLSVLGQGAMGLVYKAVDPVIERPVAIKVIQANPGLGEADLQRMQARFEQEFRSAGALSHPNVVTIFDVGQEGDHYYIAMEFVDGRTLDSILAARGALPVGEVGELAAQLGAALDYAHGEGVVHRDIKPANVMVTNDGRAKITDFGLAKIEAATLTRTGALVGTPAYMSPEQIGGHTITGRSDQFSLGVLLYQALTGERPFTGDTPSTIMYKIVHEEPLPPRQLNKSLPVAVDGVFGRCLEKDANRRFPTCTEMVDALRLALGVAPASASAGPATLVADETVVEAQSAPPPQYSAPPVQPGGPSAQYAAPPAQYSVPPGSVQPGYPPSGAPPPSWPSASQAERRGVPAWLLGLAIGAPSLAVVVLVAVLVTGVWIPGGGPPSGAAGGPASSPASPEVAGAGRSAGAGEAAPGAAAEPEEHPESTGAERGAQAEPGPSDAGPAKPQPPAANAAAPAGAANEVKPPAPPPRPPRISYTISSEPAGARIVVDGERSDRVTPAEIMLDTASDHHLDIIAPGHESAHTEIHLAGKPLEEVPRSLHFVLPEVDASATNRAGRIGRNAARQQFEGIPEELRNAIAAGQVSTGHLTVNAPIAVGLRVIPASRNVLPAQMQERLRNASPEIRRRLAAGFFFAPATHHEVDLPAGQWRIALTSLRVLYFHEEIVLLRPNQTLSLGDEVPATFFRVSITSEPAGARVRVDGLTPIATPYNGPMAPGEHELEFTWPDGSSVTRARIDRNGQRIVGRRQ